MKRLFSQFLFPQHEFAFGHSLDSSLACFIHPGPLMSKLRNNLGTVYNMMRDHEKAQEYFIAAQEVAGHDQPDKNDLWSLDTHAATDGGRARMARQRRSFVSTCFVCENMLQ